MARGIKKPLPADSKSYSEQAFLEKEKWHRRRARMSFVKKLEALDRLLEMGKQLPKLTGDPSRSSSNQ